MNAYMVSAVFGDSPHCKILLNACIAPSPEAAACMATYLFCKELGNLDLAPIGINVQELTPEFMRRALNGGEDAKVFPFAVVGQT